MRILLTCLVVLVLGIAGAHTQRIAFSEPEFGSRFLVSDQNAQNLLGMMSSHFNTSLDYLFASKRFGSQYVQYPGLTKLLAEESDRHWEEGMSVLKKYLHLGGRTDKSYFFNSMVFGGSAFLYEDKHNNATEEIRYKESFLTMTERSRGLVNTFSDTQEAADFANRDIDVDHFLEEKAEKESDVARTMLGRYKVIDRMYTIGIAVDTFDKTLA